jgi:ubiquinone/menaquinone biosynthesis C-methylase UbiE
VSWRRGLYHWATRRLYHEFAWAYDLASWLVSLGQWSRWRGMALDYATGPRVLEIGFGTGELLAEMAGRGLAGVGLELSPAMHRVAAWKLARRGWAVPRVQAGSQAMPFADGRFDSIVSTFPSAYVLDPATHGEIARLLRPPDGENGREGGRLVVVGLAVRVDRPLLRLLSWALFGGGGSSVPLMARFVRLAEEAGLRVEVEEVESPGFGVPVIVARRERF